MKRKKTHFAYSVYWMGLFVLFVSPLGFYLFLGMLPGTGNFASGVALQNFAFLSFFCFSDSVSGYAACNTLGPGYSSSLFQL